MSRLTQILRGKKVKPLTEIESAVKYAVDHARSGGGGDLPAVTSDDNGDVLTVVSGAWAKADPPSGLPAVSGSDNGKILGVYQGAWSVVEERKEITYVDFSATDQGLATSTTIEEIGGASANSSVVARIPMGSGTTYMPLVYVDNTTALFSIISYVEDGTSAFVLLGIDSGSGANWQRIENAELPAVTASDNGKVLGVADGAWGTVTPASFAPYAVTGTLDESGGKETITLNNTENNLTAKDLYDAIKSGVMCEVSLSMPVPDVGTINMVVVTSVVAAQSTLNGNVSYNFAMISADGKQFFKEGLVGTDTVILDEVVQ